MDSGLPNITGSVSGFKTCLEAGAKTITTFSEGKGAISLDNTIDSGSETVHYSDNGPTLIAAPGTGSFAKWGAANFATAKLNAQSQNGIYGAS